MLGGRSSLARPLLVSLLCIQCTVRHCKHWVAHDLFGVPLSVHKWKWAFWELVFSRRQESSPGLRVILKRGLRHSWRPCRPTIVLSTFSSWFLDVIATGTLFMNQKCSIFPRSNGNFDKKLRSSLLTGKESKVEWYTKNLPWNLQTVQEFTFAT